MGWLYPHFRSFRFVKRSLHFHLNLQVKPTASLLNSYFSYILRIPNKQLKGMLGDNDKDMVYIWTGDNAHPGDEAILEAICHQIYPPVGFTPYILSSYHDFSRIPNQSHAQEIINWNPETTTMLLLSAT